MSQLKPSIPFSLGAAALGALLLVLAACGRSAILPHRYVDDGYRPIDLNQAAESGGMPTAVVGNPFAMPKSQFDTTVTELLESNDFGLDLPFLTAVPENPKPAYHVVVVFDPPVETAPSEVCTRPDLPSSRRPGEVSVLAAFCQNDRRITSAGGHITGAWGPDDPAFHTLMRQVATSLFPPGAPGADDNDGRTANLKLPAGPAPKERLVQSVSSGTPW